MPLGSFNFMERRNNNTWKIIETGRFIFHVESSVIVNDDLKYVMDNADKRFENIADVLGIDYKSTKANERFQKYNSWIHSDEILTDHDEKYSTKERKLRTTGAGIANFSGVNAVIYKDNSWKKHERMLLHEEVHLIWFKEVGEAPALLNEGVAVYAEYLLTCGLDEFIKIMRLAWEENINNDTGLLKKLMDNEYFWNDGRKVHEYYKLGSILVWYILKTWGIHVLKDIFLNTFYDDEKIVTLVESKTNKSINEIEEAITKFLL